MLKFSQTNFSSESTKLLLVINIFFITVNVESKTGELYNTSTMSEQPKVRTLPIYIGFLIFFQNFHCYLISNHS